MNVETRKVFLRILFTGKLMTSDAAVKAFLALDMEMQQEVESIITSLSAMHSVDKGNTSFSSFESVLLRAQTKDNWSAEDRQKLQAIQQRLTGKVPLMLTKTPEDHLVNERYRDR